MVNHYHHHDLVKLLTLVLFRVFERSDLTNQDDGCDHHHGLGHDLDGQVVLDEHN